MHVYEFEEERKRIWLLKKKPSQKITDALYTIVYKINANTLIKTSCFKGPKGSLRPLGRFDTI